MVLFERSYTVSAKHKFENLGGVKLKHLLEIQNTFGIWLISALTPQLQTLICEGLVIPAQRHVRFSRT